MQVQVLAPEQAQGQAQVLAPEQAHGLEQELALAAAAQQRTSQYPLNLSCKCSKQG